MIDTPKPHGGPRKGAGRKAQSPTGESRKSHTLSCTGTEYKLVIEFLGSIRATPEAK